MWKNYNVHTTKEEIIEKANKGGMHGGFVNTDGAWCATENAEEFKEMLERRTGLEVHLWDERLTTVAADKAMIEAGLRREERKEHVDKVAAVFILQGYLDKINQS